MRLLNFFIYFFFGMSFSLLGNETLREQLSLAAHRYAIGDHAATIAEKEDAFNFSLELLTALELSYSPTHGKGKLYYNIANNYLQLGIYPLAVYYYRRSQLLMPRALEPKKNLSFALDQLGIQWQTDSSSLVWLFLFHQNYSLPERLQALFFLTSAALISFSIYIWTSWKALRRFSFLCLSCALVVLSSACYSRYITPIEAILVHPSKLYREMGKADSALDSLLLPGSKLRILRILGEGHWMKVMTENKQIGYLPDNSMEIL